MLGILGSKGLGISWVASIQLYTKNGQFQALPKSDLVCRCDIIGKRSKLFSTFIKFDKLLSSWWIPSLEACRVLFFSFPTMVQVSSRGLTLASYFGQNALSKRPILYAATHSLFSCWRLSKSQPFPTLSWNIERTVFVTNKSFSFKSQFSPNFHDLATRADPSLGLLIPISQHFVWLLPMKADSQLENNSALPRGSISKRGQ